MLRLIYYPSGVGQVKFLMVLVSQRLFFCVGSLLFLHNYIGITRVFFCLWFYYAANLTAT